MPLGPGSRVGPYEIVGSLGAGGMGEVSRAHDPRLKRDVALKILPEAVAADPERLARFDREVQVLAALKHPHIATIHGIEEGSGVRALVLELVEGETLATRIASGAVPIPEAVAIARQIADALEAAHEQSPRTYRPRRDCESARLRSRADRGTPFAAASRNCSMR